jgi:multidrug efflux pump subunit AcrA (membrane-fusion protein)
MPATSRAAAIARRPAVLFDRRIAVAIATSTLLLTACGPGGAPPGGPGAHGGPPPVSVVPAVQRPVQTSEEFSARIEARETVDVRSRVAGTLEQVHYREGQRVARGAPLLSIDARPYAAEVQRLQAQEAAARTQLELNRAERVRGEKLLPMQVLAPTEY